MLGKLRRKRPEEKALWQLGTMIIFPTAQIDSDEWWLEVRRLIELHCPEYLCDWVIANRRGVRASHLRQEFVLGIVRELRARVFRC